MEIYDAFIDLVERMLTYSPTARITPEEALRHPFVTFDPDASPPEELAPRMAQYMAQYLAEKGPVPGLAVMQQHPFVRAQAVAPVRSYAAVAAVPGVLPGAPPPPSSHHPHQAVPGAAVAVPGPMAMPLPPANSTSATAVAARRPITRPGSC